MLTSKSTIAKVRAIHNAYKFLEILLKNLKLKKTCLGEYQAWVFPDE